MSLPGFCAAVAWLMLGPQPPATTATPPGHPPQEMASPADGCEALAARPSDVERSRMRGDLHEALRLAESTLDCPGVSPRVALDLWLEIARIQDRLGLHHNRRPVAAALEATRKAATIARDLDEVARARVELALADYHYRAETRERRFPLATGHTRAAIEMSRRLADRHLEADAVHKLGLIHLQLGELEQARDLFDRSLELDRAAGARVWFCGEYERHVALVHLRRGDDRSALPHLRRSLECRLDAGALDAALFAASLLGSVLVRLGNPEEGRGHLESALATAERIGSPRGKAEAWMALGRAHEALGDAPAAREAYEKAELAARAIDLSGIVESASTAIQNLSE